MNTLSQRDFITRIVNLHASRVLVDPFATDNHIRGAHFSERRKLVLDTYPSYKLEIPPPGIGMTGLKRRLKIAVLDRLIKIRMAQKYHYYQKDTDF